MSIPKKAHASTVLKYSPRKARLIINLVRGLNLEVAMERLACTNKQMSKKIYLLLKSAASNFNITESQYQNFNVESIVAEEAQILQRFKPRARMTAGKIRRRYSRVKVMIRPNIGLPADEPLENSYN